MRVNECGSGCVCICGCLYELKCLSASMATLGLSAGMRVSVNKHFTTAVQDNTLLFLCKRQLVVWLCIKECECACVHCRKVDF